MKNLKVGNWYKFNYYTDTYLNIISSNETNTNIVVVYCKSNKIEAEEVITSDLYEYLDEFEEVNFENVYEAYATA